MYIIQDTFLTQHVIQLTRGNMVSHIVLSTPPELVDNIEIYETLTIGDHNKVSEVKSIRKQLANLDWTAILKHISDSVHTDNVI